MEKNIVSEKVQKAVVKAIHTGEDVVKVVGNITREIIKTSKDEDLNTKEKVQKLTKEAIDGVKDGAKKAQPSTEEFIKKSTEIIKKTVKENAPKVANFAKEIFEGIKDGTKEVINESKKKQNIPENEESEKEEKTD